jgi:hypothetical protein
VIGGHAVGQRVRTAGVLRHIAADGAGALAGGIGRVEIALRWTASVISRFTTPGSTTARSFSRSISRMRFMRAKPTMRRPRAGWRRRSAGAGAAAHDGHAVFAVILTMAATSSVLRGKTTISGGPCRRCRRIRRAPGLRAVERSGDRGRTRSGDRHDPRSETIEGDSGRESSDVYDHRLLNREVATFEKHRAYGRKYRHRYLEPRRVAIDDHRRARLYSVRVHETKRVVRSSTGAENDRHLSAEVRFCATHRLHRRS